MTIPSILFPQSVQQHPVLQPALDPRVRAVPLQVLSQRAQIGPSQLHPPFGYPRGRIMNYALRHALNPQLILECGRFLLPVKLHRVEFNSPLSGGGELGQLGRHALPRHVRSAARLAPRGLESDDAQIVSVVGRVENVGAVVVD